MRALVLLMLLFPGSAAAGAWPRTSGEIYVFSGQSFGPDGWTGLYVERGGPGKLTFGLDIGGHMAAGLMAYRQGESLTPDVDGRAMIFVRIPLAYGPLSARFPDWVAAADLGLGADFDLDAELDLEPRYRVGVSVGRGLGTRFGDGWISLDLRAELGGDAVRYGMGAVAGLKPTKRITVEMGIFGEFDDELSVTFAPTIQYSVPWIGDVRLGAGFDLDGNARLQLGLARTF